MAMMQMTEFSYVGFKWKIIDFLIGSIGLPLVYTLGGWFIAQLGLVALVCWTLLLGVVVLFGVRLRRWIGIGFGIFWAIGFLVLIFSGKLAGM